MASTIAALTSGGGGISMTGDASGILNLNSNGTTVASVSSTGMAVTGTLSSSGASTFTGTGKFATTIGVGNATPSASGSGITFPATQSASSDATTLDDYEEGTFTPTVTPQTGSLTAYTSSGSYVKIGKSVTISIRVTFTTVGTAAGQLTVTNLPFVSQNINVQQDQAGVIREYQNTGVIYYIVISNNSSTAAFQANNNGAIVWTNLSAYSGLLTYISA